MVLIPAHYVAARVTFLGAEAVIHEEEVRFHWLLGGALTVTVIASFAGALWRKGGKAFAWHSLVAVLGVVVVLAFPMTKAGAVDALDRSDPAKREDRGRPANSVCHSGGDSNECVGG